MTDFQVIFMDAGQGDCTLIVYPDNTLTLIDCGSTKSGDEAFAQIQVVLDNFLPQNKYMINNLVLTHPDEDHYNKIKALGTGNPKLKVGHVYYGGDIKLYRNKKDGNHTYNFLKNMADNDAAGPPANSINVTPDGKLSRAGVNVTILAANATGDPGATAGRLKNSNSIVLMVEYGPVKMFLMGDAFIETENFIGTNLIESKNTALIQRGSAAEVVLKMGHHGSDTSTGSDWVKAITPNVLLVSSGTKRFSSKGMPTKSHLENTVGLSSLITTDINQSFVVFDESKRGVKGQDFVAMSKTTTAIWTTCYDVTWDSKRWVESGQTWYYGVEAAGRKKTLRAWHGYTGYEEEDDVEDDT